MTSPAPVNVAPLIKFSRWALLSAGIVYGMGKHAALSIVENKRRERLEKFLQEQEITRRQERQMRDQAELLSLHRALFPDGTPRGQEEHNCKCEN